MAIQGDGKIVAVGSTCSGNPDIACDFALARYNPNGSLDTSFSGDGKQTTDFGDIDSRTRVALQGDGKIVAVGVSVELPSGATDFALARYNPNGSLDTSFSGDGKQTTDFGSFNDRAHGVALQADGKIVGRRAKLSGSGDFALARYNPNGSLDTSFSGDGKQTTDFGGSRRGERGGAPGRRQDRRGRRSAAPAAATSPSPATTRTARSTRASPATASRRPTSAAPTGRAGWRSRPTARSSRSASRRRSRRRLRARPLQPQRLARHELLRRRQADDRLRRRPRRGERRWRSRPTARSSRSATAAAQRLRARPLQPQRLARHELLRRRQADDRLRGRRRGERGGDPGDGKIVVVGRRRTTGDDFALARYNPNGSLDTSFSGDGKQTTDFGRPPTRRPGWRSRRTARSSSVGSACSVNACDDFALARYNPNGSLDTSFSGDGKQTTDFGASTRRTGWRSRATARSSRSARAVPTPTTSRSPATTRTARSTRASPATASRRPTSGAPTRRTGWRSRRRQDRRGRPAAGDWRQRLRARPLQPERLARHELLRRRQADDRLRRRRRGEWGGAPGATARSSRLARGARRAVRLRARPLQPQRLARHELLRRRQADDQLRVAELRSAGRTGWRSGRRQDRRGGRRHSARARRTISRLLATSAVERDIARDTARRCRRRTWRTFGPSRSWAVALWATGYCTEA